MLDSALFTCRKSAAVRYPRGGEFKKPDGFSYTGNAFDFYGDKDADILLVTYGRIFSNAYFAAQKLANLGISACILKLNVIKPIEIEVAQKSLSFKNIVFFEEGIEAGGVAQEFGLMLSQKKYRGNYKVVAVPNEFVDHAPVDRQLKKYKLDTQSMISEAVRFYSGQ